MPVSRRNLGIVVGGAGAILVLIAALAGGLAARVPRP